jgi:hypothetical protein
MINIKLIFGNKYQDSKSEELHQEVECDSSLEQKFEETCPSCCCESRQNKAAKKSQAKG